MYGWGLLISTGAKFGRGCHLIETLIALLQKVKIYPLNLVEGPYKP